MLSAVDRARTDKEVGVYFRGPDVMLDEVLRTVCVSVTPSDIGFFDNMNSVSDLEPARTAAVLSRCRQAARTRATQTER